MSLAPRKIYLPFSSGPFRMAMGLVARDPDDAIELDELYPEEMAERRRLLAEKREIVFAALPGSEPGRRAVWERMVDMLPRRYPAVFRREGRTLRNLVTSEDWDIADPGCDPLEAAGRLVQEDLCLMSPGPEGAVLTAAVLCFPSRWSLEEKLGQPMMGIHAKVPFYGEKLGRPVDRFFAALAEGKLVERLNWGMTDDAALFQPGGKWRRVLNPSITAENAGDTLWLRVERQTLSRVGTAGDILFTIRVHAYPVRTIAADPAVAAELAAAVAALPDAMQHYKSIPPFRDALLAYLRR